MTAPVKESIYIIQDDMEAVSGKFKDEALLERFVADPELKQHIRQTEKAFPKYELIAE
ncbi:hypothetical protein [Granulicella arctica]|uniref:hypothetical protein n=1 Tax=Granulicella arctica TaxID=940613 RepID=UPI0021DF9B84|nr:hypothetical protein [Granulicella arctica]